MDGKSLNIAKDLISKLKEIIPAAFTEDKLNIDQLKQLLGEDINSNTEPYILNWAGKQEAYKVLQTPTFKTLKPDFENSVNWDSAENIFIEGENLETLKVIQKSYYGKVKLILIDPPYNTGSDSFIYPDKFSETKEEYLKRLGEKDNEGYMIKEGFFRANKKENGQFHSNWLSMMLPRLFLARNLLKDDGAIVIHIDEHEQANLTLLLNEVFGENNLVGNIIWDKGNPKGDASGIAYQHESILVYAKNRESFLNKTQLVRKKRNAERILKKANDLFNQFGKTDIPEDIKKLNKTYKFPIEYLESIKKPTTLEDINGQFKSWLKKQSFTGGELAYNNIDSEGNVYRLVSMAWPNKKRAPEDYFIPLFHPTTQKACPVPQRGWRFPTATMKELLDKGEIIFGDDESVQPQRKYLLKNNLSENIPSILFYGGSDDDLLRKLDLEFENPKPVDFTKGLVNAFTSANSKDIVLDFFAGSGTTAHAVIEANNDDKGNRKFVCIQLSEPLDEKSEMFKRGFRSIAELTKNRIKSIVDKCNSESESKLNFENNLSIGLRCFNLSESNFKIWRGDMIENESDLVAQMDIFTKVLKESSKTENILWELIIKGGLSLTEKPLKVVCEKGHILYLLQNGQTVYCLDAFNETVQLEILKLKPKTSIFLDDLFNQDDCSKTNTQLKFQDNQIEFKTI